MTTQAGEAASARVTIYSLDDILSHCVRLQIFMDYTRDGSEIQDRQKAVDMLQQCALKAFALDAALSAGRITQELYDESMDLARAIYKIESQESNP